ncbi:MAG: hypothetical protein HQ559_04500, partial [Lentisphaerae bacterium]|nr:hypothetical protein [Lentisphaerota bacterium]
VLAEAGAESVFLHPRDGWVEVEPEQHYRNVCRVIRELAGTAPGEIAALAMAAASGNTLLTEEDGTPLTNIINWMDKRAEQDLPAVLADLTVAEVARITGWPCITIFPLGHLGWLHENRPDLCRDAGRYAMDTDWLLHRLTGRWIMDPSTASTFMLYEQTSGTWHEPYLEMLDIRQDQLSELVDSGVVVGPLTADALRDTGLSPQTRLVTGSFDHPGAARSVGVLSPGELMLSCGTSWVGFTPFMDRQVMLEAGLICDPFLSSKGGPWGGIFSVPYIGRTVDWYVDHVIAPGEEDKMRVFNESAAEAEPGAGGLRIDLQADPGPVDASRANVSRAVMESAARLLNEKIVELKEHGFHYSRAVMVGGPSNSPIWPGIVQEITGIDLTVGTRSAGAGGAAVLAGIGVGLYRDEQDALKKREAR